MRTTLYTTIGVAVVALALGSATLAGQHAHSAPAGAAGSNLIRIPESKSTSGIEIHMPSRRQLLFMAGAALGLSPALGCLGSPGARANQMKTDTRFPVQKTDDQWRDTLSLEQYKVLREHGTERAFTSPLNNEKRPGTFVCAGCRQLLFSSDTKYESGTGWPSFYKPLEGAVGTTIDRSLFAVRTEVHCARCGGHLGHVFPDGPPPTGERYCMNGVAMKFEPKQ